MKKILIIICGAIILLTSVNIAYHYITDIDVKQLNYSFLYWNYKFDEKESIYLNLISRNIDIPIPTNNLVTDDEQITEATLNNDGSKILMLVENLKFAVRPKVIEYDVKSKAVKTIISGESKYDEEISGIQCIPNSNLLSFRSDRTQFATFDMNNMIRHNYDIDLFDYTWAKDGKSLLYTDYNNANIQRYDIQNKTSTTFVKSGRNPVYSNDNRYIAFKLDGYLVVKDLFSNIVYKHKLNVFFSEGYINSYRFSPDDKYIMFSQYNVTIIGGSGPSHIVLWDFLNSKDKKIKDNIRVFYDCK